MSIKIKQQKLLKPEDLQKKSNNNKKSVKQVNTTQTKNTKSSIKVTNEETKKNTKGITILSLICFLTLIYFIAPKPQLLTYEKMGITNQSIYWPGFYKFESFILDSNLKANANIQANNLFLCHKNIITLPCQKYRITDVQGPLAVMVFLYKEKFKID